MAISTSCSSRAPARLGLPFRRGIAQSFGTTRRRPPSDLLGCGLGGPCRRCGPFRLASPATVPAGGELDLQLRRVAQHDIGEVRRGVGRMDRSREPGLDQRRQPPAVVEVGVGEDHGIQCGGLERERHLVSLDLERGALEHAAVDEHPPVPDADQELRAVTQPAAPRNWMLMLTEPPRGRGRT